MLCFLDTNIVSYILAGNSRVIENFEKSLSRGDRIAIPEIVYYEIQRGIFYNNSKKLQAQFDAFCKMLGTVEITKNTFFIASKIYAELKRQGKIIEDADIIIAATAIEHSATLATNNAKHIKNVKNLKIKNWM